METDADLGYATLSQIVVGGVAVALISVWYLGFGGSTLSFESAYWDPSGVWRSCYSPFSHRFTMVTSESLDGVYDSQPLTMSCLHKQRIVMPQPTCRLHREIIRSSSAMDTGRKSLE